VACPCTRRRLRQLPLLLALAIGATPVAAASSAADAAVGSAVASRWALPAANMTKRSALLGGPSRMEQILVGQRSPVRTASLSSFAPAALPSLAPAAPAFAASRPADIVPANGAPNVFGSVALAVSRTPLDEQWRRANATRQLGGFTGAFRRAAGDDESLLRQVNAWVNRRITFTDDARTNGRADRWAGAAETLRRGRGDCEDYALAKMQLLQALGYNSDRLYLVIARDLVRRADHAVLVAQLDGRFVVLDNMSDEVIDSSAIGDYRPIMSYSAGRRWVHGYAAPATVPAPIQIASSFAGHVSAGAPSAP
jgi:predicted transglutaminase-like cysteine proteinase